MSYLLKRLKVCLDAAKGGWESAYSAESAVS